MVNDERTCYRAVAVVLGFVLVIQAFDRWAATGACGLPGTFAELRALRAREVELQAQRRAAVGEWRDAWARWAAAGEIGTPPPRPERWLRVSQALQDVQTLTRALTDSLDA